MDSIHAVQVDDYAYTGTMTLRKQFEDFMSSRFDTSKFSRGMLSLMSCKITQDHAFIVYLSREQMLSQIESNVLLNSIPHRGDHVATLKQAHVYRHLIGKLLYTGHM